MRVNEIINKIIMNSINKKKTLKFNKNINKKFINIFIKLNIIKYSIKYNNNIILILNFFKNNKLLFNIKNIYKPSNYKLIKLKNLKKLNKLNKIIILSTNKGILNNFESEKKKTGGIALFYVWN